MKKTKVIMFTIIIIVVSIMTVVYINEPKPSVTTRVESNADLTFAVLGDVHENIENFQETIKDLYTINPRMDALVLNGDTVDQGLEKQYNSVENTLRKNIDFLPKTIIKNIGNHEFYDYNIDVNSPKQVQSFIHKYLEFSGEEKVYHDKWLNGYHFISLGSEDGNSETLNSISAFISDEQLNWFKEKLSENYQSGKPIFVFLHQPLDNSSTNFSSGKQIEQIIEILSKYPEAIVFSSHTHRDLVESSVVLDKPFTMINTGAIHYTIISDTNSENGRRRESYIKGIYIEVNGNNVIVNGRDFKEKQWIFTKEISR